MCMLFKSHNLNELVNIFYRMCEAQGITHRITITRGTHQMKIRGIKRGQTIELLEPVESIPDGAEIIVDLEPSSTKCDQVKKALRDEERLEKLNQLFGVWKDQPELIEIFAEMDNERHSYRGRVVDSIDNLDNI